MDVYHSFFANKLSARGRNVGKVGIHSRFPVVFGKIIYTHLSQPMESGARDKCVVQHLIAAKVCAAIKPKGYLFQVTARDFFDVGDQPVKTGRNVQTIVLEVVGEEVNVVSFCFFIACRKINSNTKARNL